jgi:sugar phosphate isomerase/epimerase
MYSYLQEVPFRVGTTSYIIPDDILPNVRYLSDHVRDVELVLFELDDGPSNLPDTNVIAELNALAAENDLTYTVHLPLDLRLGADGDEQHVSLVKARRVIEATRALQPWAYVLHLDGKEVRQSSDALELRRWQDQSVRALELAAAWAGGPQYLAVENLERYPLNFLDPVLERIPVSRCVDIGHLWLDGHDPLPYLERALPRTRVIHIHGIGERDHQSLGLIPFEQRTPVLQYLLDQYRGVLTLEIFNEPDLQTSLAALADSLGGEEEWENN